MIDNTTTITRWNRHSDWRNADISETDVLKSIKTPATCFLSANAFGLKGKIPGGKHTWVATFNGTYWKTYEITDIETIEVQKARMFYAEHVTHDDWKRRQLIISNRDPSTVWFGNQPRLDAIFPYRKIVHGYPKNDRFNLITNNCSTYLSYIAWAYCFDFSFPYIGFKPKEYWDILLDK